MGQLHIHSLKIICVIFVLLPGEGCLSSVCDLGIGLDGGASIGK